MWEGEEGGGRGISIQIIFANAKIYLLKVVKHKINIGGFSNFDRDQDVNFWGKVFVKARYVGNLWPSIAYSCGDEAFSIHIKRKLQKQDNMNVM